MSVNPLETVVPPQAPPAGLPSPQPTPAEVALAKKYGGDWTKANEGYFNLVNELKTKNQSLEQIAQRNQQLEAYVSQSMGLAGGQPASFDPFSVVERELGLPAEPLRKGVRAEAEAVLMELLGPVFAQAQADEALADEIPDFPQLKGQARVFMKANPEIEATFNAVKASNPSAAWKYAIRETLIASGGAHGPQAPRNAGLPGSANAAGRVAASPQGIADQATQEKEALEYGRQYGDMGPYRNMRFKGTSIERAVRDAFRQIGYDVPGEGQ